MRQANPGRRLALTLDHVVDNGPKQAGHQRLWRVRYPTKQQRRGVAEPALELPRHSARLGQPAPAGGLPDQEGLVVAQQHYRRDHGGSGTQRGDLRAPLPPRRRGGVGGSQINSQHVHLYSSVCALQVHHRTLRASRPDTVGAARGAVHGSCVAVSHHRHPRRLGGRSGISPLRYRWHDPYRGWHGLGPTSRRAR